MRDNDRVARVRAWAQRQSEVFESHEVQGRFAITSSNAHQVLSRLVEEGSIVRVSIGSYRRAAIQPQQPGVSDGK